MAENPPTRLNDTGSEHDNADAALTEEDPINLHDKGDAASSEEEAKSEHDNADARSSEEIAKSEHHNTDSISIEEEAKRTQEMGINLTTPQTEEIKEKSPEGKAGLIQNQGKNLTTLQSEEIQEKSITESPEAKAGLAQNQGKSLTTLQTEGIKEKSITELPEGIAGLGQYQGKNLTTPQSEEIQAKSITESLEEIDGLVQNQGKNLTMLQSEKIQEKSITESSEGMSGLAQNQETPSRFYKKDKKYKKDVIEYYIGSCGTFQLYMFLLLCFSKFCVALQSLSMTYMAPSVSYICPSTKAQTCPCPNPKFNTTLYKNTIVMEWRLICENKWLVNFMTVVFNLGCASGSLISGIAADMIGRKPTLLITVTIQVISGFVACVVEKFWAFAVIRFLTGAAAAGLFVVPFVLTMELIGNDHRVLMCLFHTTFTFGHMMSSVYGYVYRDFRDFQEAITYPSLIMLTYYCAVRESPRWLLAKRRTDEAIDVIRDISLTNERPIFKLRKNVEDFQLETETYQLKNATLLDVFRKAVLLKWLLACSFIWFSSLLNYIFITQSINMHKKQSHTGRFVMGIISVSGTVLCYILLNILNRRRKLFASVTCFSCIASYLFLYIMSNEYFFICANIVHIIVYMVVIIVYLQVCEIFPTVVRGSAMGFAYLWGRVGSMLTPYVLQLHKQSKWFSLPICLVLMLFAALLTLQLPETKNYVLLTTLKETEEFEEMESKNKKNEKENLKKKRNNKRLVRKGFV